MLVRPRFGRARTPAEQVLDGVELQLQPEALAALQKSDDGAEAIRQYRERYGEDGSRVPAVERQEALEHLQKTVQYWQRKVQAKSKGRIAMMLRQARAKGKATVKSAW